MGEEFGELDRLNVICQYFLPSLIQLRILIWLSIKNYAAAYIHISMVLLKFFQAVIKKSDLSNSVISGSTAIDVKPTSNR